jgi:hypothetical protein
VTLKNAKGIQYMARLVKVSKIDDEVPNFPWKSTTLYKHWHTRKNVEIFVKLGGSLYVDLDAVDGLVEANRGHEAGCKGGGR